MTDKKITPTDVRNDFPEEKRQNDRQAHLWAYLVVRPLSFYLTPFFVNRGISANVVTGIGLVVLLSALTAVLAAARYETMLIVGAILINVWYLLDFVDGNIARYTNLESAFGAFFDWYVGIMYHTLLPLCVGTALYLSGTYSLIPVDPVWWLILAVAWVTAGLLRRLTAQKVSLLFEDSDKANGGSGTLEMLAGAVASFKAPTLLVFAVVGAVDVWILLYTAYNLSATSVQLILNVRRIRG